jgi:hypothetical protein
MKRKPWYRARIQWAEMVEGRGIRHWEERLYLFRSSDREAAFRRALEIGRDEQSVQEERTRRGTRRVETRLAAVLTLDCVGSELSEHEGPLERCRSRRPATQKIAFEHHFEPDKKTPIALLSWY